MRAARQKYGHCRPAEGRHPRFAFVPSCVNFEEGEGEKTGGGMGNQSSRSRRAAKPTTKQKDKVVAEENDCNTPATPLVAVPACSWDDSFWSDSQFLDELEKSTPEVLSQQISAPESVVPNADPISNANEKSTNLIRSYFNFAHYFVSIAFAQPQYPALPGDESQHLERGSSSTRITKEASQSTPKEQDLLEALKDNLTAVQYETLQEILNKRDIFLFTSESPESQGYLLYKVNFPFGIVIQFRVSDFVP